MSGSSEGHERHAGSRGRNSKLHHHFFQGHSLCLPRGQSPGQDDGHLVSAHGLLALSLNVSPENGHPFASFRKLLLVEEGLSSILCALHEQQRWDTGVGVVVIWPATVPVHNRTQGSACTIHQPCGDPDIFGQQHRSSLAKFKFVWQATENVIRVHSSIFTGDPCVRGVETSHGDIYIFAQDV